MLERGYLTVLSVKVLILVLFEEIIYFSLLKLLLDPALKNCTGMAKFAFQVCLC